MKYDLESEHWEGGTPTTMAYVVGNDRGAIVQADLGGDDSNIELDLFDLTSGTPEVAIQDTDGSAESTLEITTCVFDTLEVASDFGGWTKNTTGHNFRCTPPWPSGHPIGGHSYLRVFKLITSDWGTIPIFHLLHIRSLGSAVVPS